MSDSSVEDSFSYVSRCSFSSATAMRLGPLFLSLQSHAFLLFFIFVFRIFFSILHFPSNLLTNLFGWQWKSKQQVRFNPLSSRSPTGTVSRRSCIGFNTFFNNNNNNSSQGSGVTWCFFNPAQDPIIKEAFKVISLLLLRINQSFFSSLFAL